MSEQFWLGTLIAAGLGILGWIGRQLYTNFQRIKNENERLRDSQDSEVRTQFQKSTTDLKNNLGQLVHRFEESSKDLEKRMQSIDVAMARMETKLERFISVLTLIDKLNEDVQLLKARTIIKERHGGFDDEGGSSV